MSRSTVAIASASPAAVEAHADLYSAALSEVISAALDQIARGKRPERSHQANYSVSANGMPSLSDGWYPSALWRWSPVEDPLAIARRVTPARSARPDGPPAA